MYQFDTMGVFTKEQFHQNGEHIERTKNMESPCKYCECNYCSHEACKSEKCGECSPEKHKNTGCLKSMYRATLSSVDIVLAGVLNAGIIGLITGIICVVNMIVGD